MSHALCIYHGNCTDGFAAAWAVRNAMPGAEFVSATYGSAPPDVTGRTVYIVDFSYPRDVLLAMAEKAAQIVVLDHHKTAAEQLVDLPANVQAIFDMERSGCMLAWQHFFGHELPPQLLLHIQDRDLWTWKLPHTKEILAAVFNYEHDFETWDRLMWGPIDALREEGRALLRKHEKDIGTLLPSARPAQIAGYTVPAINLPPMMASDAGAILAQGQPFAAVYWDTRSGRQYSLRSAPDGVDVAEIAQQFGGGGHKHAAGFKVPFGHPLTLPELGDRQRNKWQLYDFVGNTPLFDFATLLHIQREFSERTFGPGSRAKGIVAHIRKELLEIEAAPDDLTEWVDVAILALDGAWRTGASPQQIIDALVAKQAKNESRAWPDWREMAADAPIEHDRTGEPGNVLSPREALSALLDLSQEMGGYNPPQDAQSSGNSGELAAAPQPAGEALVVPADAEEVSTSLSDDAEVVRRELGEDSEIAENMGRAAQIIDQLTAAPQPPEGARVVDGLPRTWRTSIQFARDIVDAERDCRAPVGNERAKFTNALATLDALLATPTLAGREGA